MTQTFQSGYESTLAKLLSPTGTLFVATAPTATKWRVFLDNGAQEERISYTWVSWLELTWLTRRLSQTADPATWWTGLTWVAWTKIVLVAMHDQLIDKEIATQSLQEAKTYATTAARDSALWADWVATKNYVDIKCTDTWLFYNYNTSSNVWEVQGNGVATWNASTVAAWSGEIATSAESIAWTDTWGTWAKNWVLPSDIAANEQSWTFVYAVDGEASDTYVIALTPTLTAYTAWQRIRFKATTINTWACTINVDSLWAKSIKDRAGNDPVNGLIAASDITDLIYDWTNFVIDSAPKLSTDAIATTWTDIVTYITPKQAKDNYWQTANINGDNVTFTDTSAHVWTLTIDLWVSNVKTVFISIWLYIYDYNSPTYSSKWRYLAWNSVLTASWIDFNPTFLNKISDTSANDNPIWLTEFDGNVNIDTAWSKLTSIVTSDIWWNTSEITWIYIDWTNLKIDYDFDAHTWANSQWHWLFVWPITIIN